MPLAKLVWATFHLFCLPNLDLRYLGHSFLFNDFLYLVRACLTQGWAPTVETTVKSQILILWKGGCSYVADVIFTLVAIERGAISKRSQYVAIKNPTYVQLAEKLGIRHTYFSSANNTGNVMESLCWLAYEQKRDNFILSIVKFATDFEYPVTVAAGPAAAYPDTVAPGPAAAVAPGPADCPSKRPAAASGPAVAVASGPAAATAPGPAKRRRTQTSAPSAKWGRQASSQRDVQETAAIWAPATAAIWPPASASGHQATPASGESSGRRAAVQDREPSEDEEDYGECRCMSTWTKAKLEDYAKLKRQAMGRQEEMERQADWFDAQVDDENSKRQERSNRGQPLEMLRQTTTVPDTDLPTYLEAYLSLCGQPSEVWDRRFETLEERFGRKWSVLRCDIALSVAEPKTRNEEEVDEAFERFKLVYKEACLQHFSKQTLGPQKSFFRDVFHDKAGFMEYLRSGTVNWYQNLRG